MSDYIFLADISLAKLHFLAHKTTIVLHFLALNYAAITELRIKLRNFFRKLRESLRSFLVFVPNKYRDTLCKHFTINSTSSWSSPR